ncbi:DUF4007 family protein [Oscillatoria sp. CS-180]|uniref:DUF4007 family protein n=1 Tax=Oscillatoria sp. CS-180 TaxID=3021720 RepID=UPI00232D4814|nr:DUF4007 family protein [Oscillatoria sp. CS-180]MDB9527855.1 DUF4007 family protein [Oscillatoria sp. CS-180]
MSGLQLSFHGTFALKKEDVLKILQAAQEEQGLKDSRQGLMDRTGLGNEKVLRIKSWAIRAGLVQDDKLSPEGVLILEKDPYLESPLTDWFMHFYLSFGDNGLTTPPDNPADWGGWTWFIYSFLPDHRSFTHDELVGYASTVFPEETTKKLTKNLKILLRAYTETYALSGSRYLYTESDDYISGQGWQPNEYLTGYFLAKIWERDYLGQTSVLTEAILSHKLSLAAALGISTDTLQERFNALEVLGIIEQRREVPPFQILPRWDSPLELLEQAYDHNH